jgi:N6-L-threonylcarbamoyladenine synthase
MKVLAIESTCDETAAAVVEACGNGVKVLSSVVASSALIHQKYGGVVPEVAAREQVKSIIPVISEAISSVGRENIEAITVSYGPGLMGSLLIGVETAKVLSATWNIPLIKVNHMAAHVAANWIINSEADRVPSLPAIGLVVSGGHTDLILMKSVNEWEWIGGTRDDACGEAFDKAARIIGLAYPGGPSIQKAIDEIIGENERKFVLPRPMIHEDGLEMSFSGLKAALNKIVLDKEPNELDIKLLAKEFNNAVVDVLVSKTLSAREKYNVNSVLIAGGVAANKGLRERMQHEIESEQLFIPELKYCGDNAAMVGAAAILRKDVILAKDLFPIPSLQTV